MTRDEAIDRIIQERLEDMSDCPLMPECDEDDCWECGINEPYSMALDALKAEAVRLEIVSCKDCKHWKEWENGSGHCGRSENPHFWFGSDADDFCSFGERREP